jgi:hypothetical protein
MVLLQGSYKTSIQSAVVETPLQALLKRKGYYIPNKNKRNITIRYKCTWEYNNIGHTVRARANKFYWKKFLFNWCLGF